MNGTFLLVFVVLLSGFLAYYGDVVGRKMGKKRLKFGRLRPRHTAAIMTALFGMIGSALAIGMLLTLSVPVRKMLFEGDKVKADFEKSQFDLNKTKGDLAQKQGELLRASGDFKAEQVKVKTEQGKLEVAQKDVSKLKSLAESLKKQAKFVQTQLVVVRKQVAGLRLDSLELKMSNKSLDKRRDYAETQYLKFQNQNLLLENEIKDKERKAKERIEVLQSNIDDLNKSFSELQEQYAKQATLSKKDIEDLRSQVKEAKQSLDEAQRVLDAVRADLKTTATVYRTQPLIFSLDDELARMPVRTRLNAAEAKVSMLALIEKAATVAKGYGANPSTNSGSEAVLTGLRDRQGRLMTAEDQLQALIKDLSNVGVEQVVLASSIVNSFKGEPVGLKITILPNPVIYKKDAIIAETRIDGQLTQDQIVQAISKFVQDQVGPKAVKDGMIPAIGQANPLGEINQEDLFKLIADIKSRPFVSRVKFLAAQETRAGDRLKFEFRVS